MIPPWPDRLVAAGAKRCRVKIKIEMILGDDLVKAAVGAIVQNAGTGKIGDGKTFSPRVDETIRIRNQERGVAAL